MTYGKEWVSARKETKPDESLCWLRLCTTSVWPREAASCWTAVVFPVPVSPTRSTGSPKATQPLTRSMSKSACCVCAKLPPPPKAPLVPSACDGRGSAKRPTRRCVGVLLKEWNSEMWGEGVRDIWEKYGGWVEKSNTC